MPKKKKQNEENPAPGATDVPAIDEEPKHLCLSELQLLKILRAEAEERASRSELQLAQILLDQVVKALDPEGKIAQGAARVQTAITAMTVARKLHQETTATVGEDLGVDLKKCSFDDTSGTVHVLE